MEMISMGAWRLSQPAASRRPHVGSRSRCLIAHSPARLRADVPQIEGLREAYELVWEQRQQARTPRDHRALVRAQRALGAELGLRPLVLHGTDRRAPAGRSHAQAQLLPRR